MSTSQLKENAEDLPRYRLIPQAVLLGGLTGLVSVGFHIAVDRGDAFRIRWLLLAKQNLELGPWLVLILALLAILLSIGLVRRFAPEAAGSGIPHLKFVLLANQPLRWFRILVIKFVSMLIGNMGGLILGREGPSVHMGGAIGEGISQYWRGQSRLNRSILIAAGGGSGLAAAFNAPLSGLTFVLEELERRCSPAEFFVAAIACLSADMVCRALLGQNPVFHISIAGMPPLNQLAVFIPMGIVAGGLGVVFNFAVLRGQKLMQLSGLSQSIWWLALTIIVATVAWIWPELLGGGQSLINNLLAEPSLGLRSVIGFWAIRFGLTVASACSGAAGGIFMPILALGGFLGWATGLATHLLLPESAVDMQLFVVVGMAAYFSATVQAPLTGIVLVIEMTANYDLILPLFIGSFTALLIASALRGQPIYNALMKNSLRV